MIIQSLLDTDLYKFTMMQFLLHHFPGAQVEYRFRCRTEGVNLRPHLDAIRAELAALYALRFREEELAYRRNLRFMKSDFVDFLGLFQFNEKYLRLGAGEAAGEIDITIRGPWLHTILFEIPVLAIISEVYFRRTQPRPDLDEGRRPLRLGREDDRALPQEPRRPAHQDADLLRPAVVSPRHRHRAPLPRARENRVRHRHQPD